MLCVDASMCSCLQQSGGMETKRRSGPHALRRMILLNRWTSCSRLSSIRRTECLDHPETTRYIFCMELATQRRDLSQKLRQLLPRAFPCFSRVVT